MATRTRRWWGWCVSLGLALGLVAPLPSAAAPRCAGDCDGLDGVTVEEIVKVVTIGLGDAALATCPTADGNGDGTVAVDDVIAAVNGAIGGGCGGEPHAVCGNGTAGAGEDCDDGGICIGGATAGTGCTADAECGLDEPGVCRGGAKLGSACRGNDDCPGAACQRCLPFGGDGCAANCTTETSVTFGLESGVREGPRIEPYTSGVTIFADVVTELPLPLAGSLTLTIGKKRGGHIPAVIKTASVSFPKIPLSTIACSCVRAISVKTCGGTLFDEEGRLAGECSDNIPLPVQCPVNRPCTFVHGPDNGAAGLIGCGGLDGIDVTMTQDCNAAPEVPAFPPEFAFTGSGPPGSARIVSALQVGTQTGRCTPGFCTDADPASVRGNPMTMLYTTGRASATLLHASAPDPEYPGGCVTSGTPFDCAGLTGPVPTVSGANLAAAFASCDAGASGDFCAVANLVAQ